MKITTIIASLSMDGCYIRELREGRYLLAGSNFKIKGVNIEPIFYKPTFEALQRRGLIERGRRVRFNRSQVGWFLKPR